MIPDTEIRSVLVAGIQASAGVMVTDQIMPISETTPDLFISVTSQGRTRTAVSKQNYEWMGSIRLTLVKINEKGYISSVETDALDAQVCTFMDNLSLPSFRVGLTRFMTSESDQVESPTQTISRKHIMYEIWVNRLV